MRQARVAACSRFCAEWMAANEARLNTLRASGVLDSTAAFACADYLDGLPVGAGRADAFMHGLRLARNEVMFVIAWRDLVGVDALEDTLEGLSAFADAAIGAAVLQAGAELSERFGMPEPNAHESTAIIVIGMGKLGARELNFSSDIDLVFAHEDAGATDGARSIEAAEYYKRLARRVVQLLSEQTEDGFVFRVDTRLRPFGEAGPLVVSTAAMENYYQSHGREWERYAWIKARPVAGDLDAGHRLLARMRPFVYRRYLDYGAFESIREMKALIEKQVAGRGHEENIKIGSGGIREIEFVAQAFQLIRGGQEPALQQTSLLPALAQLEQAGHLPEHVAAELRAAYAFLRRLENRLQMWNDRQTHELPRDEAARAALATAMGYERWERLADAVRQWRQTVEAHFRQVFAAPQAEDEGDARTRELRLAWTDEESSEGGAVLLADAGYAEPERAWAALVGLRSNTLYRGLGERGRRRLAQLVPLLVQAVAAADAPDETLHRLIGVLERILGRTAYVALLVENPAVLSQLVALCGASAWITYRIETQPILLDSLLDPRLLYHPPSRPELRAQLDSELAAIPEADLEQRMDALRRFQHEQTLRVAAADVTNSMPLMIVSDYLTDLAEVVVGAALSEAWRELVARHGTPRRSDGGQAGFAVIGYGKLGGVELGYGSDLDLVFVHDGDDARNTDGDRRLSHPAFFLRLGQRVIHLLSTQTSAGRAYEVDTRLRPSGRSGLLVVGMAAFEQYQSGKAWTWEHQALVRARQVAGDRALGDRFRTMRNAVLAQAREPDTLRDDVASMRRRMRQNLDRRGDGELDLKQTPGGLIDIEFLAQYAVLRYAGECPELLIFTDTIRILETLESGQLLDYATTKALTDAYRAYRVRVHAAALQQSRATIAEHELWTERTVAARVWNDWLGRSA